MYHESCSGGFTEFGELMSPNNSYFNRNYSCIYTISQTEWAITKLEILHFDLGQWQDGCSFGYLEIRDGINENSDLFGKYCGKSINTTLISTQNHIWMK